MKMKASQIFALLFFLTIFSCEALKNELNAPIKISKNGHKLYYVADHRKDCVGEGNFRCLQIKEKPEDNWSLFYGGIEGFDYEEGYTYVIEVSITKIDRPPADGSSNRVELIKIWVKEKT